MWTVIALVVAVALALAWHLSYTAARLDRLHARVEGSLASLDAQLVRRAEAAAEYAQSGDLDPASALLLASAAADSLQAAEGAPVADDVQRVGVPEDRALAESALTHTLTVVVATREADGWDEHVWDDGVRGGVSGGASGSGSDGDSHGGFVDGSAAGDGRLDEAVAEREPLQRLADACDRVELAFRFHNEAVRDVRRVRAQPVVRVLHLAGRTHLPEEVAFDTRVDGLGRTDAWG